MMQTGKKALSLLLSLVLLLGTFPGMAWAANDDKEVKTLNAPKLMSSVMPRVTKITFVKTQGGTVTATASDFVYGGTIYTKLDFADDPGYETSFRWYYGDDASNSWTLIYNETGSAVYSGESYVIGFGKKASNGDLIGTDILGKQIRVEVIQTKSGTDPQQYAVWSISKVYKKIGSVADPSTNTYPLTVNLDANSCEFNGDTQKPTVTSVTDGTTPLPTNSYVVGGAYTRSGDQYIPVQNPTDPGNYYVKVTFDNDSYKGEMYVPYSIEPKSVNAKTDGTNDDLTVAVNGLPATYTGSGQPLTVIVTDTKRKDGGVVAPQTLTRNSDYALVYQKKVGNDWTDVPASDLDNGKLVNVGTYRARIEGTGDYKDTRYSDEFTIAKASITTYTPPTANEMTYNGQAQTLATGGGGLPAGTSVQYALGGATTPPTGGWTDDLSTLKGTDAGDYSIWYKLDGGDNYSSTDALGPVVATIEKADTALTSLPVGMENLVYTGNLQNLLNSAATATHGTVKYKVTDASVTVPPTDGWGTGNASHSMDHAGPFKVWYYVDGGTNYKSTTPNYVEVSIAKAPLTVTAKDKTIVYGDAPANNGVNYSGFVNGESPSNLSGTLAYDYNYAQYGDVGDYAITPKGLTSGNYNLTYVSGKLTVTKKNIANLTWPTNRYFPYNGKRQMPTVTSEDVVNGDDVSFDLSVLFGDATNVGEFGVATTGISGEKAGNYSFTPPAPEQFYIIKAPVSHVVLTVPVRKGTKLVNFDISRYIKPGTTSVTSVDATFDDGKMSFNEVLPQVTLNVKGNHYQDYTITVIAKEVGEDELSNTTAVKLNDNGVPTGVTDVDSGNLKDYTDQQSESTEGETTVDVVMSVEPVQTPEKSRQKTEDVLGPDAKTDTIDVIINETKTITNGDETEVVTDMVTDAGQVLEIVVDYDMTGKYCPVITREHEEGDNFPELVVFRRLTEKPDEPPYEEGTYYVDYNEDDPANSKIYIYSQYFSKFTIGYVDDESYTVIFDANGGVGTDDAHATTAIQTLKAGEAHDLDDVMFKRSGYTFAGWNTKRDGSGQAYANQGSITLQDEDVTLYAQWEKNPSPSSGGSSPSISAPTAPQTPYPVTLAPVENGAVVVDQEEALPGATVTVTVAPDKGYQADKVIATDADGKQITATRNPDGTFSFEMPEGEVRVSVIFSKRIATPVETGVAGWLSTGDHILYILGNQNAAGIRRIRPNGIVTRAETAMMFYRLLKNKDVAISKTFSDVEETDWFAEACGVLASLDIIDGYQDGTFRPDNVITRSEFAKIATRFAVATGGKVTFPDVPEDHWAAGYIATAADYGWIEGYQDGLFHPDDNMTRATAAKIINCMLGRVADRNYVLENRDELIPFVDLQDPEAWYYFELAEASIPHEFTLQNGAETWVK
ncbi:MAG: S-layer homology domain-containing protein [Oscillospiraceae bacterium]|nr:S-layer homology domain-containing protein [Oscillospiraceae bacterium]